MPVSQISAAEGE